MSRIDKLLLFFWFYLGWFGCVYFARQNNSLPSLIFPLVMWAYLFSRKLYSKREILFTCGVFLIGSSFDSMALHLGWITSSGGDLLFLPLWLFSMWLLFSTSISKFAVTLSVPRWSLLVLGAVMGPLTYKSGEAFGILTFHSSQAILYFGIFWALFFFGIVTTARRYL